MKINIKVQEQHSLDGFVIVLAHIDRSLIWADELINFLPVQKVWQHHLVLKQQFQSILHD